MSDHGPFDGDHGARDGASDGPSEPERTGHPAVDAVIASLDVLGTRPVSEHVAVFESAHEGLRAALSDADAPGA
jgi:hypothetical protein